MITDEAIIREIFERGTVAEILPSKDAFIARLMSGARLRVYIGFDPTGTALHIGHMQNLLFLEDLRKIGHEAIVLFGDFTARIGDPDKSSARTQLTEQDVKKNAEGWVRQVEPLVSFSDTDNPAKLMFNNEWLSALSFSDVVSLASNFTVQQMLERDMFDKRIKAGTPIHLHEFLYPLMQGYDSVAMDVDVELCATDQIFNALAGRTLLKKLKGKDKDVVALRLVANPKTGVMMSKSKGSGVFLDSTPSEMFGALMAQPDEMTKIFFESCTRLPIESWKEIEARGPKDAKMHVAHEIVRIVHGEDGARTAQVDFENTFAKGGLPETIEEVALSGRLLVDALIEAGIVTSKTEWRRLVEEGAVKTETDEKITDKDFVPTDRMVLKVGKRRFVRVVL